MANYSQTRKIINRSHTLALAQKVPLKAVLDYASQPILEGDLDTNGNNLLIAGLNTDGIKVGNQATSDYGWEDKEGVIQLRGIGAGEPAWTQIGATAFYGYLWQLNDVVWIDYHVPHDIVPNTNVYFHTHWLSDNADVTNSVKWQWQLSYALGFGQEAHDLANPTVITAEAVSAGQYYGNVTETAQVQLNITEPDGIIKAVLTRITNGGTNHTGNVFMNIADMHYQSTGVGTANKAPGFYNI